MKTPTQTEAAFLAQRRAALRRHPTQTGIDYIEVEADGAQPGLFYLKLHFVPAAEGIGKVVVPTGITTDDVRIAGGESGVTIRVEAVIDADDHLVVVVREQGEGEIPTYTLQLVNVPNLDPFFAQIAFSLKVDEPGEFDCRPSRSVPSEVLPVPEIDYLARDYSSFRKLMLDRLSVVMPHWAERNPADLGMALVETLAYAADRLSYYQDAVATEAYLGTARRRISVRRHARLLDYALHEGCNARAWVQVQVADSADRVLLDKSTPLLTRVGPETRIAPEAYETVLAKGPEVFEALHPAELFSSLNELFFYTWGAREFMVPRGATSATLKDEWVDDPQRSMLYGLLKAGDVLLFEEVKGPTTGNAADADPAHRHAVRLTRVTFSEDPLGGHFLDGLEEHAVPVVEIEWHAEDALPFALHVSSIVAGNRSENVSVARGNMVLVDHGRTITGEPLLPALVPETGRYRPRLRRGNITHRVPFDDEAARKQSATAVLLQDAREALPVISLHESGARWTALRDLLSSDRFAREFVMEMESDRQAYLRFGDGVHGKQPTAGAQLEATYRVGTGLAGNVGHEAIAHVVTADTRFLRIRNPLPARGGIDPEPIEQVRLYAPQAFRAQERAVTEEDYAAAAQRFPEVKRAAATLRWTGSRHTVFVTVQRVADRPVDDAFKAALLAFLERFRLTGHNVAVHTPRFVPLDIALTVQVAPGHFRSIVHQALLETFSNVDLPGGRRGFFHPDSFTFGQPVYLSQVITTATRVPGVAWIEPNRFQRWGQPPRDELREGQITIGPLAIARLDNNPDAPQNGTMAFYLEGGR